MAGREPFSRHRRRAGSTPERDDGWDATRAADYAASAYGWGPAELDRITDEQLVAYFDSAQERIERDSRNDYERRVEAVRIGTIFAHDSKQYASWRARITAPVALTASDGGGLSGAELDSAIDQLALRRPDLVMAAAA